MTNKSRLGAAKILPFVVLEIARTFYSFLFGEYPNALFRFERSIFYSDFTECFDVDLSCEKLFSRNCSETKCEALIWYASLFFTNNLYISRFKTFRPFQRCSKEILHWKCSRGEKEYHSGWKKWGYVYTYIWNHVTKSNIEYFYLIRRKNVLWIAMKNIFKIFRDVRCGGEFSFAWHFIMLFKFRIQFVDKSITCNSNLLELGIQTLLNIDFDN